MEKVCCKKLPMENVCFGEVCRLYDCCPNSNHCGAIRKSDEKNIERKIDGNDYPLRSKKMQAILNSMDYRRFKRKWFKEGEE